MNRSCTSILMPESLRSTKKRIFGPKQVRSSHGTLQKTFLEPFWIMVQTCVRPIRKCFSGLVTCIIVLRAIGLEIFYGSRLWWSWNASDVSFESFGSIPQTLDGLPSKERTGAGKMK